MKSIIAASVLALASSAAAWEISFWPNENCVDGASSSTSYYIYSGADNSACINFGDASGDGFTCSFFTNGGVDGPFACDGPNGSFNPPDSFDVYAGSSCDLSLSQNCANGPVGVGPAVCTHGNIQSFTCQNV